MSVASHSANPAPTNPLPSASLANPAPVRRRRPVRQFLAHYWVPMALVLFVIVMLFLMVYYLGRVTGEEFSPDTFQTREFFYYEIPIVRLQVFPIIRKASTPAAATSLTQRKLVPVTAAMANPKNKSDTIAGDVKKNNETPAIRWDLVWVDRVSSERQSSDAALLVEPLKLEKNGTAIWIDWSTDHPKLAAILWPTVAKLARRELYILIPRLLELSRDADDPVAFRTMLDDYQRRQYRGLIEDMRAAGQIELAEELAAEVRKDFPDEA